ncbi:MAG: hypothetical protein AAF708_21485 [Deinococcota bacterium]
MYIRRAIVWFALMFALAGLTSAQETHYLFEGFLPDPYVLSFVAGGPDSAFDYGPDCFGDIATEPDHVLYLGNFDYLKLEVTSEADTTLVVYGEPYGDWLCNDDGNGLNPVLEGSWLEGLYYVYVGSFDGLPEYQLNITEVR